LASAYSLIIATSYVKYYNHEDDGGGGCGVDVEVEANER
jgi:hypothetical protein